MAEINELLDIDPTRVDMIAGPARPAVPSARRFLFFKSNQTEERTMEKEVVRDLDSVLADLQKASGEDKAKINSELIGLVKDVKASVADIDDPMKAEVAKAVADKIEAVLKSDDGASAKDELASLINDLNSVIKNLQKADEKTEDKEDEDVNEALAKSDIPEEMRNDVARLMKEEAERIAKAAQLEKDALKEQLEKADKERTEQRARIEKMEREARRATWIAKADVDFAPLPAKSDEIVDLIMKAEDADNGTAQKLVDLLKASAEIIKKGDFYKEIGTSEDFETSPEGKVEALAKSYLEQGVVDTLIEGKAKAWKEHPEYRREAREGE